MNELLSNYDTVRPVVEQSKEAIRRIKMGECSFRSTASIDAVEQSEDKSCEYSQLGRLRELEIRDAPDVAHSEA